MKSHRIWLRKCDGTLVSHKIISWLVKIQRYLFSGGITCSKTPQNMIRGTKTCWYCTVYLIIPNHIKPSLLKPSNNIVYINFVLEVLLQWVLSTTDSDDFSQSKSTTDVSYCKMQNNLIHNIEVLVVWMGQALMREIDNARGGVGGLWWSGNGDLLGTVVSPTVSDLGRCNGKSVFGGLAVWTSPFAVTAYCCLHCCWLGHASIHPLPLVSSFHSLGN
jgi:hypothetical protein